MDGDRIQKLLLSEYCDFSDTVLVESPFAETTRDGRGIREVALGLTPSRLIVAADILKKNSDFLCHPDLDPSIESLELVSVYPLELVTLSIFRRRRRRTLKARLIDGRAKYYELGGIECRSVFWSVWCENVRNLLARTERGSSLSETTAASSTSVSSLCLLSSGFEFNGIHGNDSEIRNSCRIWARYGGAGDGQSISWPRKDVYLGPSHNELNHGYYTPIPVRFAGASLEDLAQELRDSTPHRLTCKKTCSSWPCGKTLESRSRKQDFRPGGNLCDVLFTREEKSHKKIPRNPKNEKNTCDPRVRLSTASETSAIFQNRPENSPKSRGRQKRRSGSPRKHGSRLAPKLSRFGFGVGENCSSGLYLEPWNGDRDHFRRARSRNLREDPGKLIDSAVNVWEAESRSRKRLKHPRRYGLSTAAHFFHALGPWSVQPGERESVQRKRASSAVGIRRQPAEPELRLPVSKRQLAASISMTSLHPGKSGAIGAASTKGRVQSLMGIYNTGRVVLFWTPDYWYRPRAAAAAYRELQKHLNLLRNFRLEKERNGGRGFFSRKKRSAQGDCWESENSATIERRSSGFFGRIFSSRDERRGAKEKSECREGATSQLKRLLRMDLRITAWDLDSATIARQLTLLDRDLFSRIPCAEIEILVLQRSSRNAPNLGAWVAFSHRISCLAASEILATKKLDMRTRLLSRFINAADKCYKIGNFQSCRSILAGLQSPPIYRLRATWSRLRIFHSTRYETMERLCKIFRSTRGRSYRRAWNRCEKRPPVLPFVGDLLARILDDPQPKESSKPGNFVWKNRSCSLENYFGDYCENSREKFAVKKDVGNKSMSKTRFVGDFLARNLDDPQSKESSKPEKFVWKNRPCNLEKYSVDYSEDSREKLAIKKDVGNKTTSKKSSAREDENIVEGRRSLGRRIFSAAVTRMKRGKSSCSCGEEKEDFVWAVREKILTRWVFERWRGFVLARRIRAEREMKLRNMDARRRKIVEISGWLLECQRNARGYNFSGHSLAWEFLLKARYKEDRENFFVSLKLEPP